MGRRGPKPRPDYEIDPETGCWVWLKFCNPKRGGYPSAKGGRPHRINYVRKYGKPPAGYDLHHVCHNKLCVNPDHLEARPWREHRTEHWLGRTGLDFNTLREIRELGKDRTNTLNSVAAQYGVNRSTVEWLWLGKSWPEVTGGVPVRPAVVCALEECDVLVERRRNAKYCCAAHRTLHNQRRYQREGFPRDRAA